MAIFQDFYNGISRSRLDSTGFPNLQNCDVHTEFGYILPQLALAVDSSGGVPDEAIVSCKNPNGIIYAFSKTTGKVWTCDNGSWVMIGTTAYTGVLGCAYYNGNIVFATATRLLRFGNQQALSTLVDCGALTSASYRPMAEVNLTLFIGNGKDIASLNSSFAVNTSALDLPTNFTVSALTRVGVDLLIGTVIGSYVSSSSIFLWDTYSDSWTLEDEVPEVGVNCFIKNDDMIFAQCGTAGQLYYWNGNSMVRFRKIPGVTTTVAPYNSTSVNGRCLFATGTKIFSIHRADNDLAYAIVQEYTTTSGDINSISTYRSTLVVSAGTHIDKVGVNYATAVITTPEVAGNSQQVIAYYDSLPTGTSIGIATQANQSGSYTAKTPIIDTVRKIVYFDGGLGDTNFLQAQITLTPSGTLAPKLRYIEIK